MEIEKDVVMGSNIDNRVYCAKCGYCEIQKDLHLHHLVPITLGGDDSHGRRWLCKKHHDILHNMLIGQVWKFVVDKEKARQQLKEFSLWWISQK